MEQIDKSKYDLVFERTTAKLWMYEEELSVSAPTVEQVQSLQENAKKLEGSDQEAKDSFEKVCEMLAGLGVPERITKKMETAHIDSLIKFLLTNVKKN